MNRSTTPRFFRTVFFETRRVVLSLAAALGIKDYVLDVWSKDKWEHMYSKGNLDYFDSQFELARYGVIGACIKSRNAKSVLDAGCGKGLLYEYGATDNVEKWIGVDLSEHAVCAANEKYCDDRCGFIAKDLLHQSESDEGNFDVVVLNEVIYMCEDPELLLSRVSKQLGEDGVLVISIWRHRGERYIWRLIHDSVEVKTTYEVKTIGNKYGPNGWRIAVCSKKG